MLTLRLFLPLALLPTIGCSGGDPRSALERKPVPEVRHHGFREDVGDERRGNATFFKAVFTPEGNYLVTFAPEFSVWDPRTGALLQTLRGTLDGNDLLAVDGTHHRLLARRGDVAPHLPEARGLGIWDLRDGSRIGMIPETDREAAIPIGFTGEGEPVVFRERRIEVWHANGGGVRMSVDPPAGLRFCERGSAGGVTYNDKQCFELSSAGRRLAVAARDVEDHTAASRPFLVDLVSGRLESIPLPDELGRDGVTSFAFSSDERMLAVGVRGGLWIRGPRPGGGDGPAIAGLPEERAGPAVTGAGGPNRAGLFIAGEHQRNRFLIPMAFTARDTRIVALGDQLQVSTFDVATGALVGRVTPPFEDWEGALRVSADGSRAIAYRFLADVLVVIDGESGTQRGYVCPYFCNRLHNPVEVPYAVSPDGRRIASGGRLGAGLWDTDADTLIAPLHDPRRPPLKPR
jgi:hypothetical protein